MSSAHLGGGLGDPARDAAYAFRSLLNAMARPGTLHAADAAAPPAPLSPAAGTVILTLCDPDTPVYLADRFDTPQIRGWIAFHTSAPIAPKAEAAFAVGDWAALLPLEAYPQGIPAYPDRSATLIVEMEALGAHGATLQGPGIETTAALSLPEVSAFQANRKLFPRGLDFIFTCGTTLAALPRTTQVS